MTTHIQLFGKPIALGEDGSTRPPLTITGELDGYNSGEQYEGRLQVNNAIGFCSLQVLPGTQLPADASISMDYSTKEIVIRWDAPAATETTVVPGGDFENEHAWDWQNGWRWITGYDHLSGTHSGGFADFKGNSWLPNTSAVPVIVGTKINCKVSVQQGGSSAGNVRAGVALQWLDASQNVLSAAVGNIITSGSHGEWHDSNLSATVPANCSFVRPLIFGSRKRENTLLYVDDFTWDLSYFPGAQSDDDYPIFLKVTDSEGRVAYWNGVLSEYTINLTSEPFPVILPQEDSFGVYAPQLLQLSTVFNPTSKEDFLRANAPQFTSLVFVNEVEYGNFTVVDESRIASAPPVFLNFTITVEVSYGNFTIHEDALAPGRPALQSFTQTHEAQYWTIQQDGIVPSAPQLRGFTLT